MGTIGSPPNTRGQQEAQIPRNDATKELSNPRNEQEGFIARNKGSKKPSSTEKQKIGPNPSKRWVAQIHPPPSLMSNVGIEPLRKEQRIRKLHG